MNILFNYAKKKNKNNKINKKDKNNDNQYNNKEYVNQIEKKFKEYKKHRKYIHFDKINDSFHFDKKNENDIAIIIPYRNREEHLNELKKHFKDTKYDIYIIEQCDTQRFNRGLLLNIGYYLAKKNKNYKYYIFHDVDSLPNEKILKQYNYTGNEIIHFASPYLDYKYKFHDFLGGVLGMSGEIFEKINGYPNKIYGWGGEDDMLYNRIAVNNYKIYRPKEGKYILLEHQQATEAEEYPYRWEGVLKDLKEWKNDGLKEGKKDLMDTNFIILLEKKEKGPNIFFYKVKIPIQHLKKHQYISLMRPLITWKEVKENVLDTFMEPEKFDLKNKLNHSQKIFEELIEDKMTKYENINNKQTNRLEYTKKDLEKTLKFIFDTYRDILYLRIRQNHIEFAFHLYNSDFTSDWYKYVKFPNNMNVYQFMKKKQKNLPSKMGQKILSPNKWTANNCVVSFEDWSSAGNPTEYVKGIYEMFIRMVEKYKKVPDCDILINRKDFQYLHIQKDRYAYTHVYPENVKIPNNISKFWFICSQSTSKNNLDIPIPSSDEFKESLKKENLKNQNFNNKKFEAKEDKLFFRGGTTGCGLNENTNPRLRLYMISDILNKEGNDFFDVGLAMFTKKIKVNDFMVGYIDQNKYKYLMKDFVDMSTWGKYKYFLNIEGNVAAYRLPLLFTYGGIVVQAESDFYMWFEPLLEDGKDYIILKKEVYMNPGDSIEESARKVNEFFTKFDKIKNKDKKKLEKIAENGLKFYKKYLIKDSILDYCYTLCYLINQKIC